MTEILPRRVEGGPLAGASFSTRSRIPGLLAVLAMLVLAGCDDDATRVSGTLEYDRIGLPAPAAERIASIAVREGDRVAAGATVLMLERTRVVAQTESVRAQARQQREALAEAEAGARVEQRAQARAQLAAAEALARDARAYHARVQPLGQRRLVAAVEVDRALAAMRNAEAQVRAARAALDELEHGTRVERLAQARAAADAAQAQAVAQEVTLDKLTVVAPRAGRVDSLPYRLGDQVPVGTPLAILLVGDAPYARVYVPEPLRAKVKIGDRATLHVDGRAEAFSGRVRSIRSEPSFTPYYALSGKDAARLSYLAEIVFEPTSPAAGLPAGVPVQVEFPDMAR